MQPLTIEELQRRVDALKDYGSQNKAAAALGINRQSFQSSIKKAASLGLMGVDPVLPGYEVKSIASKSGDAWIKQVKEHGDVFSIPDGHSVKGVSALVDAEGRTVQKWVKTGQDIANAASTLNAMFQGFVDELPKSPIIAKPAKCLDKMLCQYTITDMHLGALAWGEETGSGDYDISIGEKLLLDWFSAAIDGTPNAKRAMFAQLGDFLHYDSFKSITPEHGHVLDADTRYTKMVRVAIRVMRTIINMLLEKHEQVNLLISDANHDPAGGAWMREMFAAFMSENDRLTVDTSPGAYSFLEHGNVSLFFHHGHRRKIANVDTVFVGKFRELYGRTKFSYGHMGHLHNDELLTTNLMKIERHETLAAPDAYAANGGWLSGRSAKVIYYNADFGEVGRSTLTPEMVLGAFGENK